MASVKLFPRIAWFSPAQAEVPSSGIAGQTSFSKSYYASSLVLPVLAKTCEVELFSARAGQKIAGHTSRHFLTAWARHQERPFDIFFYNLENGRHCDFSRIHLALEPGVVWVHDFTLIDDGPEPILNSPWTWNVKAFQNNEAALTWPDKQAQFLPERPQAFRETGISYAAIFSAERDLEQFRHLNPQRLDPEDRGRYLPLPVAESNYIFSNEIRTSSSLKVLFCGEPSIESHVHSLLQALSSSRDVELTWLIDTHERRKCEELISEFDIRKVTLLEGRSVEAWCALLDRADLAVHFLYSFYQQSQPWLALSLARGLFCAVLDFSESDFLPADVAIRIFPGASEVGQLKSVFEILRNQPARRNVIAYEFALERFNLSSVAAELSSTLQAIAPKVASLRHRWKSLSAFGRKKILANNIMLDEPEHAQAVSRVFEELGWL